MGAGTSHAVTVSPVEQSNIVSKKTHHYGWEDHLPALRRSWVLVPVTPSPYLLLSRVIL
jgi:hypothetical protein